MKPAKDIYEEYLKEEGIRRSAQREKILETFLKTGRHLSIAEIYALVREKYPRIGYVTVYRAMKVLSEAGIAEEMEFGDGTTRYEQKYGHEHHDHLVCLECGAYTEAVNPNIEALQKKMARKHGFFPIRHKMQIFGICKKCKKTQKNQRNKNGN